MAEVTFTGDTLRYASLFQDVTRTTVVDCLDTPDRIVYVVQRGDIGRAIGKKGENVAKLRRLMNRDLLVVEFAEDAETFIANVFRNYKVKKVEIEQRGDDRPGGKEPADRPRPDRAAFSHRKRERRVRGRVPRGTFNHARRNCGSARAPR